MRSVQKWNKTDKARQSERDESTRDETRKKTNLNERT